MTAIEFENIGKQYRLGLVSTRTLSHDLNRWWTVNVLHREDPYLKIGETNDRSVKGSSDYVWALKDINFKVEQGDVVGIIGRNGAGKSTLLKLLSKVTAPTTGVIRARGRIGSLLEVGTGFHPEMTGRENIFMNGAILGMTKSEISRKLDEIVDFSGCERYLDTPVKRYSSGMMVRLGFAVAAHLDPEILVVDEVLAVGDAEFQKKAIGKMKDVSTSEGRTVLFVSHNMAAVRNLCKSGVLLENGMISKLGTADECVDYYLENNIDEIVSHTMITNLHRNRIECDQLRDVEMIEVKLLNENPGAMATDEAIQIELTMKRNTDRRSKCQYSVIITDVADVRILNFVSDIKRIPLDKDTYKVRMSVSCHGLPKGKYKINMAVGLKDFGSASINFDVAFDLLSFQIKYLTKQDKKEYASWDRSWGIVLHNKELVSVDVL